MSKEPLKNELPISPAKWNATEKPPSIEEAEQLKQLDLFPHQSFFALKPDMYQMTNPKLINAMTEQPLMDLVEAGKFEIDVSGKGSKKEVLVTASIELNEDLELSHNYDFTPYDKIVHDAVCTQYYTGNQFFTVDMIYRTMNGYSNEEKPSQTQKREIENSIRKMQNITLEADLTQHYRQKNIAIKGDRFKVKDRLLSLKEITGTLQGVNVNGYFFNTMPILYNYSKTVKQLQSIPFELLNLKSGGDISATTDRTVIKMYLLERIGNMKNKRSAQSNVILYKTVMKKVEQTKGAKLSPKMVRTTKNNIVSILEIFKKQRYIKDYTEVLEGNAYTKVEIHV